MSCENRNALTLFVLYLSKNEPRLLYFCIASGWKEKLGNKCMFFVLVDGGHRAVIFDRFQGVKPDVIGEGTHFMIPWLHRPIIFDIRTRPRSIPSVTGTKGRISKT
jgi:hypothetical protein